MLKRTACAMGVAATLMAATASSAGATAPTRARGAGELRDLQPSTSQPTDHATAQVAATEEGGSTTVRLNIQGLDHGAAGLVLGAHVHVGPCVAGDGATAGPHYRSNGLPASSSNEVWLDFTVGANGTGEAVAVVPFVIPAGGAASVVIHAEGTHSDPPGFAGPRWACLPVEF